MESTVSQRLDALLRLQEIDSELDELTKVRGSLPEEVSDLEDEIAGLETRIEKFDQDIADLNAEISEFKLGIKESEKKIKRYQEQQLNVRNNREYDSLTKEIEFEELQIESYKKKIKEHGAKITLKDEEIAKTKENHSERQKDLDAKRAELETIMSESEEEEKKLNTALTKAEKAVDERLARSYNKIRENANNGLAVVTVKRNACGGCFNIVPPQRQAEIRERKKIIVCEHCGRVLADVEDIPVEEPKKRTRR
jgi:predicted  nucleic acid-binding Zn-ribbon protein